MNPCKFNTCLTAYVLRDMDQKRLDALDAHLKTCPDCQKKAAELRDTLSLLKEVFAAENVQSAKAPVLNSERRQKLLTIKPLPKPSFFRRFIDKAYRPLRMIAATLICVFGMLVILTAVFRPSGRPFEGMFATAAKGDTGNSFGGGAAGGGTINAASTDLKRANHCSAGLPVKSELSVDRTTDSLTTDLRDLDKQTDALFYKKTKIREKTGEKLGIAEGRSMRSKNVSEESKAKLMDANADGYAAGVIVNRSDAPAAAPEPDPESVQPAAMDAVAMVKSPVIMRGVYGSRRSESTQLSVSGHVTAIPKSETVAPPAETAARPPVSTTPMPASERFARNKEMGETEKRVSSTLRGLECDQSTFDRAAGETSEKDGLRQRESLKVHVEKPAFTGTPKNVWSANLETLGDQENKPTDDLMKTSPPREPLPFNLFMSAAKEPFSTFAMDVDTASYTLTRQALRSGKLPDPERVRLEEIVNAFDYADTAPDRATFRVYQDGAQSPFGAGYNLLRIGVKGRRLGREEQRPAMLTFVIDVSGSMSQRDRIGFARQALFSLLEHVGSGDRIQIIAYSDHAQFVLPPSPASEKASIMAAFDRLQCNGSTNLEEGLRRAYEQAGQAFIPGAENRVILISDGVANLGADSAQEILTKVAANRKQGITCSVFGVGSGTYNDKMLQELANKGDGVYRFLDSAEEVKTAFVDDLAATLNFIAKDAKIQVEWNPKTVKRYRQMGYEKRKLTKEQFRDDTVDAGEVGSGQSVTALYELELMPDVTPESLLGTVRIRYQRTDNGKVEEIESALVAATVLRSAHQANVHFKVAASAAQFAELLRGSPHARNGNLDTVADYLRPAVLERSLDTRIKELLELVTTAASLTK
ncbi:MAG: von Willebrand factor type A domain-containing protein [bacterium]